MTAHTKARRAQWRAAAMCVVAAVWLLGRVLSWW